MNIFNVAQVVICTHSCPDQAKCVMAEPEYMYVLGHYPTIHMYVHIIVHYKLYYEFKG